MCIEVLNGMADTIVELERKLAEREWRTGKPTENGEYMVTLDAWGHRYIDVMHYAKQRRLKFSEKLLEFFVLIYASCPRNSER